MSDLIGSKLGIKEDPDGTPNPGSIGLSFGFSPRAKFTNAPVGALPNLFERLSTPS